VKSESEAPLVVILGCGRGTWHNRNRSWVFWMCERFDRVWQREEWNSTLLGLPNWSRENP